MVGDVEVDVGDGAVLGLFFVGVERLFVPLHEAE